MPSPIGSPSRVFARWNDYWRFGSIAAAIALADAATKAWAVHRLSAGPVWAFAFGEHWRLELVFNPGGAWALLRAAPQWIRVPFVLLVGLSTLAFLLLLHARTHAHQSTMRWGLSIVLGGALGNLADRVARGVVVDFVDYRAAWVGSLNRWVHSLYPRWRLTDHWPTFNLADVAICVGALLILLDAFRRAPANKPGVRAP